jgi:hypothetical protein
MRCPNKVGDFYIRLVCRDGKVIGRQWMTSRQIKDWMLSIDGRHNLNTRGNFFRDWWWELNNCHSYLFGSAAF